MIRAMARAKNTADEKAVGKVLRANLTCLDPKLFQQAEMDLVVASYEDFLIDLLKVTARPTQSILKAAASSVFAVSPETADAFAGRMCKSISYCRQKEKSAQSGKKLHSAVKKSSMPLGARQVPMRCPLPAQELAAQ